MSRGEKDHNDKNGNNGKILTLSKSDYYNAETQTLINKTIEPTMREHDNISMTVVDG